MTSISSVISNGAVRGAYQTSQSLPRDTPEEMTPAGQEKPNFSDMVQSAATEAIQNVRQAEAVVQGGLTGEVSTQRVVEATMELESAVRMTVGMRNKFVEAYQEIMRMPV